MRKFFILSLIFLFNHVHGQSGKGDEQRSIKQLNADTFVLYYSNIWHLVRPECATMFRISRVNTALNVFDGKFIDYYKDSTVAAEGNYSNGKKEGKFSFYYPSGMLQQSGVYENNQKTGLWEYFYPSGTKQQVFEFKDGQIYIRDFWDEDGKKLVDAGNGEWFRNVTVMRISGQVENGLQNGTWKKTFPSQNRTVNTEKFENGKFKSGKLVSLAGTEAYKDSPYCILEEPHKFSNAELFEFSPFCLVKDERKWEVEQYPGGMDKFYDQIMSRLVLKSSDTRGLVQIHVKINEAGKMIGFNPVSSLGWEFELIRVLQTLDNWIPAKVDGKPIPVARTISIRVR